jgi:hypothetical protein
MASLPELTVPNVTLPPLIKQCAGGAAEQFAAAISTTNGLARNGDDRTHDAALSVFRRWRRVEHRRDGAVGADPRRELWAQVDTLVGYLSSADHAGDDALGVLGDACGCVSGCCLSLLEVAQASRKALDRN